MKRGQQFLDTEGLRQRIGEQPEPFWIGDIMGDYDIEFVGSRLGTSKQEKLQAFDRLTAMSAAVPLLQAQIPWAQIGRGIVGEMLELPEIAARMPDPQIVMSNMAGMQLMQTMGGMAGGGGAARNGVPQQAEPAGMLSAQAGGNVL